MYANHDDNADGGVLLRIASWLAFLLMPLTAMASRGLPILLGLIAITVYAAVWRRRGAMPPVRITALTVFLGLLIGLVLLSATWSVAPAITLEKSAGTIGIIVAVVLWMAAHAEYPEFTESVFAGPLIAGTVLALVLMFIHILTDGAFFRWIRQDDLFSLPTFYEPIYGIQRLNAAMSALAVFIWPVSIAAWRRNRLLAVGIAVATCLVLSSSDASAPQAAILIGAAVAVIVWRLPRVVYVMIGTIVAALVIAAPLVVKALPDPTTATMNYPFLPSSTVHRLMIWNTATDYITQRPILGFGFETSRTFSTEADREETVLMRRPDGEFFRSTTEPIPLHPHNAMLQWWLELGLPGALLGACFLGLMISRLRDLMPGRAALSLGVAVTAMLMMATSYGAWQSWWLSTLALGGLLMAAFVTPRRSATPDTA